LRWAAFTLELKSPDKAAECFQKFNELGSAATRPGPKKISSEPGPFRNKKAAFEGVSSWRPRSRREFSTIAQEKGSRDIHRLSVSAKR
jgi:hypothetical protein